MPQACLKKQIFTIKYSLLLWDVFGELYRCVAASSPAGRVHRGILADVGSVVEKQDMNRHNKKSAKIEENASFVAVLDVLF